MLHNPKGAMSLFYNNPGVQDALHVEQHKEWIPCMPGAGRRRRLEEELPGKLLLKDDKPITVVPYIADLLDDAGIRVLVYNGDRDLTTNAPGSETMLDGMEWSGSEGWADPHKFDRGLWLSEPKKLGGYIKSYKNLEFLIVFNSGHLVPFNRPVLALDLITRFLANDSFNDKTLPKYDIKTYDGPPQSQIGWQIEGAEEGTDSKKRKFSSFMGSFLYVLVGLAIGVLLARKVPSKRDNYEPVATTELS
jgi:carboxypeptidase D